MLKTLKFTIEDHGNTLWAYVEPPAGAPGEVPVSEWLGWVLEQFNFGHWRCEAGDQGQLTSLIFGLPAGFSTEDWTPELLSEELKSRMQSLMFAGIFARGREEGVAPEDSALSEKVRMTIELGGEENTELHYAFELVQILKRIRKHTFVFTAPPIIGVAPDEVSALLREATRAYLFDLHSSCVSLCRAIVEAALKSKVSRTQVLGEVMKNRKGELQALIDVAKRKGVLNAEQADQAHFVRKSGNDALHPEKLTDKDAWAGTARHQICGRGHLCVGGHSRSKHNDGRPTRRRLGSTSQTGRCGKPEPFRHPFAHYPQKGV